MINLFAKILNPQKILSIQKYQYSEKLLLEDTVPANTSKLAKVSISSLGHFYCLYLTGHFETLWFVIDNGEEVKDIGRSYLRARFTDGLRNRTLFNDWIPLDLFLTPGRVQSTNSATLLTDPASNNLFYPQTFQYLFNVDSEILVDVKNDSNTSTSYGIIFHGVRIPTARREIKK